MNIIDPKVSIVVPVYNAANYLPKCIGSMINQSMNEIEIVLIDDASTDETFKILSEYAIEDSRIKVFSNPKNLGCGATRNTGVEKAKGEYILFVDADDWIDFKSCEVL